MNRKDRKELQNMKLMVEGFGEIAKIVGEHIDFDLPFPEVERIDRYNQIIDIVQYVSDNLK